MAGAKSGNFRELVSPFLVEKINSTAREHGINSAAHQALTRQYFFDAREDEIAPQERRRHYESTMPLSYEGRELVGVERLYRRTILIEPTTVCAAHCRWCLRGQYPVQTMKRDDIEHAARYAGSEEVKNDLDEVLITGGDPLMSLPLLAHTLQNLADHAPNIRTIRIGTRVPFHDPKRINDAMLGLFDRHSQFRFEFGVNVNHPVEFWPESVSALERAQAMGVRIYNQHPLLKGVNDSLATLVELYELLRLHHIEAHYLFHAIPMRGMAHHRTSLADGLELANQLCSSGAFSGRSKPRFAVLSDIGKIVIYEGTIVDRNDRDGTVLLRSGYNVEDRNRWNPEWRMPKSTVIDNQRFMMTWYQDTRACGIAEVAA